MAKTETRRRRPPRSRKTRPGARAASEALRYIETSALLAALLEGDEGAGRAVSAAGRRVASLLTFAEAARAVLRARATGRLTMADERAALGALRTYERRCAVVSVADAVLVRAGRPFPVEPIRTLDAIHLATVELLGETPQLVTVVTRDARIRENATALGYALE